MKPFEAALKGSREIGFTILSITLSLVAVFIPVLFMGGVVGRVFREFAGDDPVRHSGLGLRLADADADVVRPQLLQADRPVMQSRDCSRARCDVCFDAMPTRYRWTLNLVLRFRLVMLVVTLGTFVASVKAVSRGSRRASSRIEDTG